MESVTSHLYNDNNGACQEHREADELPHTTSVLLPKARKEGTVDIHGEPEHVGRKTDTDPTHSTTDDSSHPFQSH